MSPFERAKALNAQLTSIVSGFDVDSLPSDQRDVLVALKNLAVDVRLDLRDYGTAETRQEQQRLASDVRKRLEQLERRINKAGEYNLLGAADVAQLSAQAQQIMSDL